MLLQAAVFVSLLAAMMVVDLRGRRLRDHDRRPDALSDGLMVSATAVAVGGGLLLVAMAPAGSGLPPLVAAISGAALGLTGLWLRFSAIRQLSGSYTLQLEIRSNQPLVTTGPYAWMRHPGYTGLILQFGGVLTALGLWPSILALLPMLCFLPLRIREEEELLKGQFGPGYEAYSRRVPALVPRPGRGLAEGT